jgi:hypothetical protein
VADVALIRATASGSDSMTHGSRSQSPRLVPVRVLPTPHACPRGPPTWPDRHVSRGHETRPETDDMRHPAYQIGTNIWHTCRRSGHPCSGVSITLRHDCWLRPSCEIRSVRQPATGFPGWRSHITGFSVCAARRRRLGGRARRTGRWPWHCGGPVAARTKRVTGAGPRLGRCRPPAPRPATGLPECGQLIARDRLSPCHVRLPGHRSPPGGSWSHASVEPWPGRP